MWWALGALVLFVAVVLVVNHRRGGAFGSGTGGDRFRDASYGEGAAVAQAIHGPGSSNNAGPAA